MRYCAVVKFFRHSNIEEMHSLNNKSYGGVTSVLRTKGKLQLLSKNRPLIPVYIVNSFVICNGQPTEY